MANIKDKSIIYMKIKVISIKRDYDSPDANKSILSRIIFGEEIKQHATLALTEGDFNFFYWNTINSSQKYLGWCRG